MVTELFRQGSRESRAHKESDAEKGKERRPWRLGNNQSQFLRYLLLLLAVGVILMTLNPKNTNKVDVPPATNEEAQSVFVAAEAPDADYALRLATLVEDSLMQLHGVNNVHVAVTLSGGPRKVLAENVTSERRMSEVPGSAERTVVTDEKTSYQPVLLRSDQARQENPFVLVEYLPAIEGVVVVTDAANDSRMRLEIGRAVATLLGVAAHRVYVLPQRLE